MKEHAETLDVRMDDTEGQARIITGFMLADMVAFTDVGLAELFEVKTEGAGDEV
jgi:hypothetical protein